MAGHVFYIIVTRKQYGLTILYDNLVGFLRFGFLNINKNRKLCVLPVFGIIVALTMSLFLEKSIKLYFRR